MNETPYPSESKMKKIAREMGKTPSQIFNWFSNHRFKHGINVSLILSSVYKSCFKLQRKTDKHRKLLETFARNPNPSKQLRRQLAVELGKSESYISLWFWKAKKKVFFNKLRDEKQLLQNMTRNQGLIKTERDHEKENVRQTF